MSTSSHVGLSNDLKVTSAKSNTQPANAKLLIKISSLRKAIFNSLQDAKEYVKIKEELNSCIWLLSTLLTEPYWCGNEPATCFWMAMKKLNHPSHL